uniref:Uncharacterized protein n=1 Tax=Strigamia maritima TaxID=126957 RepID=T1IRE5_STRMM
MTFAVTWWCLLLTAPTLLMSEYIYDISSESDSNDQEKRGLNTPWKLPEGYVYLRKVDPSTDVLLENNEDEVGKRGSQRNRHFGLGKRQPVDYLQGRIGRYNMGLGKRSVDSREAEEVAIEEMKRGASKFNFGLGKRTKPYSFGLGKRWDDRGVEENLIEEYKRAKTYGFGLGKRDEEEMEEEKKNRPYQFGLGKRDRSYSFGLGKRMEEEKKT